MQKRRTQGFTLLEMLVVLGIMGMMAAVLVPRISTRHDHYTLAANMREISSALRMTRSKAIVSQKDQVLRFNLDDKTYQIEGEKPRALDPSVEMKIFTAQSEISHNGREAAIRFYSTGTSTGGRVTLSLDDDVRAVDVVWLTGQIVPIENPTED